MISRVLYPQRFSFRPNNLRYLFLIDDKNKRVKGIEIASYLFLVAEK